MDAPCPVVAINWGPWGEAGMAAVGTKAYEQALKEGDRPLSTQTAIASLAAVVRTVEQSWCANGAQFCVCDADWGHGSWRDLPVLSLIAPERPVEGGPAAVPPVSGPGSKGGQSAAGKTTAVGGSALEAFLLKQVDSADWSAVATKTLTQMGLDSMDVVTLRNLFNKQFSAKVALTAFSKPNLALKDLRQTLEGALSK